MNVLIIDDEALARSRMERLLGEYDEISSMQSVESVEAAKEVFMNGHFDVAFVDIRLGDGNGIDLASELNAYDPRCFIVFTTAYSEHALEAYDVGGVDYLLKPIESASIKRALGRIKAYHNATHQPLRYLAKNGDRIH